MRHQNTVFHQLTKLIPWGVFDRLVDKYGSDRRVRRLNSKSQLLALIYGQLSGAGSPRQIEAGLTSHEARLYHLGARPAARSTLADANAGRPAELFEELFTVMAGRAGRRARRHMGDAIRIVDATRLRLTARSGDWAAAASGAFAMKMHVVYDPDTGTPVSASTSSTLVNDITPAKALEIEHGATYVFDLGYYSYDWWAQLHAADCRFVTRFKSCTRLREAEERPVPAQARRPDDGAARILSDRVGRLPKPHGNPMPDQVREIEVQIETGKIIRLATNDLEAPASEIAALYKTRWQVELFFKWIKQNLKIKAFLGTSENAVRSQIFAALISYLLVRICHQARARAGLITRLSASLFTAVIGQTLMHHHSLQDILTPSRPPPQTDPRQITMCLS